jgi:hypothetical protein
MRIEPGRRIALAVQKDWYHTIQAHKFLKGMCSAEHPTDVFTASVEDVEAPYGIWVKPDEHFSDFSKGSLLVPWHVIVAAVLLGPDDEKKIGFSH